MIPLHAWLLWHWVFRASIEATVLGGMVLAMQFLLRRRISATWRFNLWLLVLLRLVLPIFPATRYSPFSLIPAATVARPNVALNGNDSVPPVRTMPVPLSPQTSSPHDDLLTQLARGEPVSQEIIGKLNRFDPPRESFHAASSDAQSGESHAGASRSIQPYGSGNSPPVAPGPGSSRASSDSRVPTPSDQTGFRWERFRPGSRGIMTWLGARRSSWPAAGLIIWSAVALLLFTRALASSIRLAFAVRQMPRRADRRICDLLRQACGEAGVRKAPAVMESPPGWGPALVGWIWPKLLLPANILELLNPAELRLVLLHELIHLRRRDVLMNWLWVALSSIHWFNPALRWLFVRMRADRELACDEAVLGLGSAPVFTARQNYCRAMLKLLEAFSGTARVASVVGVLDGAGRTRAALVRRRITMIGQFERSKGWSVSGLFLTGLFAATALTGAARAQQSPAPAKQQPAVTSGGGAAASAPTGLAHTEAGQPIDPRAVQPAPVGGRTARDEMKDQAILSQVESPDAIAADAKTAQALRRPIAVNFENTSLSQVADFLADACNADIFVDTQALQAEGISPADTVRLHIRNAIAADEILRLALRSAGGEALDYGIFHGVVHITTRNALEHVQVTRTYPISDFSNRETDLTTAIRRAVAPATWDVNGGSGNIQVIGQKLLVTTAEPRQREIARLLSLLREKDVVVASTQPSHNSSAEQASAGAWAATNWWIAQQRLQERAAALEQKLREKPAFQLKQLVDEANLQVEKLRATDVSGVSVPADMASYFRALYKEQYAPRDGSTYAQQNARLQAFSRDAYRRIFARFEQGPFNWNQPPFEPEVSVKIDRQIVHVPPQLAQQAPKLWDENFKDKIYTVGKVQVNRDTVWAEYEQAIARLVIAAATAPPDSGETRMAIDKDPDVLSLREQIGAMQQKIEDMYQKGLVDSHQEMIRAHQQLDELRGELWKREQSIRDQFWSGRQTGAAPVDSVEIQTIMKNNPKIQMLEGVVLTWATEVEALRHSFGESYPRVILAQQRLETFQLQLQNEKQKIRDAVLAARKRAER